MRLAINDFIHMIRSRKGLFLLTTICLISVFASLLLLEEKAYSAYLEDLQNRPLDRTLYVSGSSSDSIINVWESVIGSEMPEIESATFSNRTVSGMYYNVAINPTPYHLSYGRFFSEEEMVKGANVALLSMNCIKMMPTWEIETVWDRPYQINDTAYTPIGSFYDLVGLDEECDDFAELLLPTPIIVPLQTFINESMKANHLRVVFSRRLTTEEMQTLYNILEPRSEHLQIRFPERISKNAFLNMVAAFLEYWALLLIALVGATGVLIYWMQTEMPRYRVYLLCGAKTKTLYYMMFLQVTVLLLVAFLAAYLFCIWVTKALPGGILSTMPCHMYIFTMLLGSGIGLCMALLRAKRTIIRSRGCFNGKTA